MKSQAVQEIRKQFRREWLLIAIDQMNPTVPTPHHGHLLAHSPRREDVYEAMLQHKGPALVTYSEDELPAGYSVAL
jgi:hypothetical protein